MSSYRWNPYSQCGPATTVILPSGKIQQETWKGLMGEEAAIIEHHPEHHHHQHYQQQQYYPQQQPLKIVMPQVPVFPSQHNPAVLMAAAAVYRSTTNAPQQQQQPGGGFHHFPAVQKHSSHQQQPQQQHVFYHQQHELLCPQQQPVVEATTVVTTTTMTEETPLSSLHQQQEVAIAGQGNQESAGAKWVCYIRSCENDDLIRSVVAKAEPQTQSLMLESIFAEFGGGKVESTVTETKTFTLKTHSGTGAMLQTPSSNHSRHSFHSLCVKDRGNVVVHLLESWGANPANFEEEEEEEATTTTITTTAMTTTTAEGETITTETTTTTTTTAKVTPPPKPDNSSVIALAVEDNNHNENLQMVVPCSPSSVTLHNYQQQEKLPNGVDYFAQCEKAMRFYWQELTTSQFGAIALTRLFQVFPATPYQDRLARLTLQTATTLALHQFGNFMVSEILKTAAQHPEQFGFVFDQLATQWSQPQVFAQLAESRFGSHALESFLKLAPASYIIQLSKPLFTTAEGVEVCVRAGKHRQGNYPMQALLKAVARGGRLMHQGGAQWAEANPCGNSSSSCGICMCCVQTAGPLEELRLVAKASLLPQLKRTSYVKNMMRSLRTAPAGTVGAGVTPQEDGNGGGASLTSAVGIDAALSEENDES